MLSESKLSESKLSALLSAIKQKKELREISDSIVKEQLLKYFQQEPKALNFLDNPRSDKYKQIIKAVRARLRRSYGLFRTEKLNPKEDFEQLLHSHSSTRERMEIYPELYKKIFALSGTPKTILDLGCGINPLSFQYMNLKTVNYYAYDISEKEINIINNYFQQQKVSGEAKVLDVSKIELLNKLPKADLCFLFKITDILDKGKGHKTTEAVIKAVPAKYFVISFPTKTMSGKPMNAPQRRWMEWLCQRLKYDYQILEFENEIFYIVQKR